MKKMISAKLFPVLILASLLLSCGSETADTPKETSAAPDAAADTVMEEPVDEALRDALPALDYGGEKVTMSVQDYGAYTGVDVFSEAENGEIVNDAVYARNRSVEERLNIDLEFVPITHAWDDRSNYLTMIRSTVQAGDGAFDILHGLGYFMPGFVSDGILSDMSGLPYIDLSKKWWNSCFMDASSVDGKYYFVTGDASLTLIKNMYCIYFNQDFMTRFDIQAEELYQEVYDGKWTMEALGAVVRDCYADLNGDGKTDREDQFGLLLNSGNHYTGFIEALDVDIVERSGNDYRYVFDSEHNTEAMQVLSDLVKNNPGVYYDTKGESETAYNSLFRNGNIMMATGWLLHTDSFRSVDFKYGVLPYPKLDEGQESYKTTVLTSYTVFSVPADCKDPERAAAVLEAFGSESYRTVTPAYFETALKVKYASSADTGKMFDLIRDNISFDFGYIYTIAMDGISDQFKNNVGSSKGWASVAEGLRSKTEKKLTALLEAIRAVES